MSMFNLSNLFTSTVHSRSHLTHYVSVRWKRKAKKPAWLGFAKSKMFKIPVPKDIPEVEKTELDRLKNIYERQMLSLKQFMNTDESNKVSSHNISQIIEQNTENSKNLIDEWNARSALLRERRLVKEKNQQEETALKKISDQIDKLNYLEAKAEEIVTAEIAASSTFVTKENLDKVLDECLNNIQDYNFAIDLKGNVYKGESNIPVDKLTPANVNELISDLKTSDTKDYQSEEKLK